MSKKAFVIGYATVTDPEWLGWTKADVEKANKRFLKRQAKHDASVRYAALEEAARAIGSLEMPDDIDIDPDLLNIAAEVAFTRAQSEAIKAIRTLATTDRGALDGGEGRDG